MPAERDDEICRKALELLSDLCSRGEVQDESCLDFIYYFRDLARPRYTDSDVSVSLLSLLVTTCGLALFSVSLFVSWKLCWGPLTGRYLPDILKGAHFLGGDQQPVLTEVDGEEREYSEDGCMKETPGFHSAVVVPESGLKISHTSPDIPLETQTKVERNQVHTLARDRVQRQITEPTSSVRHNSIRRQMNLSNPDFNPAQFQRQDSLSGLGRIKPELYKQRSVDAEDGHHTGGCGCLNFILKFDFDLEQLIVKIHKAQDLPAKDFSGTSDPYVKIYLLPDRKTKHQTKVHRKTLNPVFDEVFLFPVAYAELTSRKLHFSVYDFDRFSRHDLIGQVVVDNFLELADFPRETKLCRDIQYVTSDNVDLGELMFSLCYLPTAGRLTITMIKARNLKAMDITGASDPYVKVSLMCEGRRLKKRKTSTKRNTLNPVYNEAIVFDVPPENIDQISLLIAVMDYDRVGHNEVIGVCRVGNEAESLGRDHWSEMLTYPRKPIAHWHPLVEVRPTLRTDAGLIHANSYRVVKAPSIGIQPKRSGDETPWKCIAVQGERERRSADINICVWRLLYVTSPPFTGKRLWSAAHLERGRGPQDYHHHRISNEHVSDSPQPPKRNLHLKSGRGERIMSIQLDYYTNQT
ncbi:putative synaptotagmin-9 [Scophthalmus maximus]|uniref:Putative synaptotagmin-9 n=1 Tax=Scophthalmus maximus TaxID=52904 RepID=A0A2U9BYK3_SCOMX|nr:putative synaptotagmin-9 [Scophthalmus maximus]